MRNYEVQPLDLMQYINTRYHEPFIHEQIEFTGHFDLNKFKDAIYKLIEVFPLLKCYYDCQKNVYIENEDFNIDDILRIDDEYALSSLLTESLDMKRKLIQFTLSKNFLIITISHLICDGVGFKNLIYLFCDFYNQKTSDDFQFLMNRKFSQLTTKVKLNTWSMLNMFISMLHSYRNKKIYDKRSDEHDYLVKRTISASYMSIVHTLAKVQGATLNDVFLAAYARAICMQYGCKKISIPCTVDLRKYAKDKTGIANLTGSYTINIKMNQKDGFTKTLAAVSKKMKKQKRTKNDIAGPMLLVSKYEKSTLEEFLNLYGNMNTSPFSDYTNLGILDDKRLRFNGIQITNAIGYSCLNKAPYCSIAISSFKGETTFSSMIYCCEREKEKVEQLIDRMVDEIIQSIKPS